MFDSAGLTTYCIVGNDQQNHFYAFAPEYEMRKYFQSNIIFVYQGAMERLNHLKKSILEFIVQNVIIIDCHCVIAPNVLQSVYANRIPEKYNDSI